MATDWTEYPERVETFGDLSSILETLDRHETEHGFTAKSFRNEHGRATAYTVDFRDRRYQFRPRLDRMPALEPLLDHFGIDGHTILTLDQYRSLCRQVRIALNVASSELTGMTFSAVANALGIGRPRSTATPVPVGPTPSSPIRTFGDFLADVRAVEDAAERTRSMADSMGDEPGASHYRLQAGMFEATAGYRAHPAFPHLEAHVNRHYGPFTSANLLRVRGEVCAIRHCGTTEADELIVEEVAAVLGCPGARVKLAPGTGTAPVQEKAVEQTPESYTVGDIRDLLRYQRESEQYGAWSRSTYKAVMSVEEYASRAQALAFNAPLPSRLRADVAHTLAAYRRLLKASAEVLKRELDEQALLYFVGEVADKHRLEPGAALRLSTGDFLRLMEQSPEVKQSGTALDGPVEGDAKPAPPSDTMREEKDGGRPRLGEGRNATPQGKALRNVYGQIRAAAKPGLGAKKLLDLFRRDKDFKDRVIEAGATFDEQLFRNALAWIKANPVSESGQETQSGNVS